MYANSVSDNPSLKLLQINFVHCEYSIYFLDLEYGLEYLASSNLLHNLEDFKSTCHISSLLII